MQGVLENVAIRGICASVPEYAIDNREYLEALDRRSVRQIKLTGINRRHMCKNKQSASGLACTAAKQLFDRLGWDPQDIRVLIFVTQSGDLQRPGSAFIIQKRLNIGTNCLVYDINQGCAGFNAGLTTACSILRGCGGKGLLLVGEKCAVEGADISRHSLLAGDGAGAVALEYDESSPAIYFDHYSDGSRAELLYCRLDGYGFMDGNAILLFAINEVVDNIAKLLQKHGLSPGDFDYFAFHQAQKMIVDGVAQGLGLDEEKVLVSYDEYGNTSSASIPITLTKCLAGKEKGRKKVLLCGFGIGLSCGVHILDVDTSVILPLIETSEEYNDLEKFGL